MKKKPFEQRTKNSFKFVKEDISTLKKETSDIDDVFKKHKRYLFESLGLNEIIRMSREEALKIFSKFGISNAASLSPDELKKNYRKLATIHHPDRGGKKDDMIDINNAYEVLSSAPKNTSTPMGSDYDYDVKKDDADDKDYYANYAPNYDDDDDDDVGDNVIEADFGADILNGSGDVYENKNLAESIQYAIEKALGDKYIDSHLNKTEDEYFGVHFSFKGTEEWWWRQGSNLVYAEIEPILESYYDVDLRGLRRILDYGIHIN
jgi:curved DNA-binding protein CbpA